jgi:hypothetical protein
VIDRCITRQIIPEWQTPRGDRYMSHPSCRTAMIQLLAEPEFVYVVSDDRLPESVIEARAMVEQWRTDHEAAQG